ncbi:MAG: hypothetical protein ACRD8U_19880 [Pyrinomonadaceae bacterium]
MLKMAAHVMNRYGDVNWTLADQGVVSGVNFLISIFIARLLGIPNLCSSVVQYSFSYSRRVSGFGTVWSVWTHVWFGLHEPT